MERNTPFSLNGEEVNLFLHRKNIKTGSIIPLGDGTLHRWDRSVVTGPEAADCRQQHPVFWDDDWNSAHTHTYTHILMRTRTTALTGCANTRAQIRWPCKTRPLRRGGFCFAWNEQFLSYLLPMQFLPLVQSVIFFQ